MVMAMRVVVGIVDQHHAVGESQESTAVGLGEVRRGEHLRRRATGHHATGEQQHVIGVGRLGQIVRGHHHCATGRTFLVDDIEDPSPTDDVEARDRFIEQEDVALLGETLGHEHSLTLSTGELVEMSSSEIHEVEPIEGAIHDASILLTQSPEQTVIGEPAHRHDLAHRHRQLVVHLGRLEHVGHTPPIGARRRIEHPQQSLAHRHQTGDRVEQAGFPRSVGAHQRGDGTGRDREGGLAKHGVLTMGEGEVLGDDRRGDTAGRIGDSIHPDSLTHTRPCPPDSTPMAPSPAPTSDRMVLARPDPRRIASSLGRPIVVALAVVGLTLMLTTGVAAAHATAVSTSPADMSTIPTPPESVSVVFDEDVTIGVGGLEVRDMSGRRVDADDDRVVDGLTLSVGLIDDIGDGTFVATYRVRSADGHPVNGSFLFGIGVDVVDPAASISTDEPGWEIGGSIARFALMLAALLAAGVAWFLAFVHDDAPDRWTLIPVVRIGSMVALLAAIAVVIVQAALLTGDGFGASSDIDVITQVLSGSLGWSMVLLMLGLAAVHASTSTEHPTMTQRLALVGALAVTGSFALFGHASEFVPKWLSIGADAVHVSAAALWLGGLVGLAMVMRSRDDTQVDSTAGIIDRFSGLAMVSVIALAVSGLALTLTGSDASWTALVSTTWGRLVLVKIAILALVVVIAAWNRRVLVPTVTANGSERSHDRQRRWSQLRRSVALEAMVLVIVLTITAVLVDVTPARTAVPVGAFTAARAVDTGAVTLSVEPARVGVTTTRIQYTDTSGTAIDVANTATIEYSLPDQGIGPITREVVKIAPGRFTTTGPEFSLPGTWIVTVGVRTGDFSQQRTSFEVPISR